MVRLPNPQLAEQWRRRLRRFDNAGTSVARFCRQEQCSTASFYQWRRKLQINQVQAAAAQFVAVDLTPALASEQSHAIIEIELPGGAIVRLPPDSQPNHLQNAVAAIVQATTAGRAS